MRVTQRGADRPGSRWSRVRIVACVLAALGLVGCPGPSAASLVAPRPGPGGDVDMEYGADGLVTLDVRSRSHAVHDAAAMPGGAVAILGRAYGDPGSLGFVVKLGVDGRPVAGFGDGGVVEVGRWTPSRLVVTDDGAMSAVGGTPNEVAVARFDADGSATGELLLVEVPVPEGHVAVGVRVSDAVADDGGLLVAGRILINVGEDVDGCCAIEPDHIPFRLRLAADGSAEEAFGPGGFQLEDVEEGEGRSDQVLSGSPPRAWGPARPPGAPSDLDPVLSVDLDDGRQAVAGIRRIAASNGEYDTWLAVWAGTL